MNATPRLRVHLGASPYLLPERDVVWDFVELDGQPYLKVGNVDAMGPFFMSIVGDSDLWLFAGSNGAFVAGRVRPEGAMFPYVNVDQILARPDSSGAHTSVLARRDEVWALWEPWQDSGRCYDLRRHLYKHAYGTSVLYEETNCDLQLQSRWELSTCREFGLVRTHQLTNLGALPVTVRCLDGFHKLLPPGLSASMYTGYSYLASAYMRHDRVPDVPLGVYTLNSRIVDRAEPAESLRATVGWALGLPGPKLLLSDRQLDSFRCGAAVAEKLESRGEIGACLTVHETTLAPGESRQWIHVADTGLDHAAVVALRTNLGRPQELASRVAQAVEDNRTSFHRKMAAADGLQSSGDRAMSVHHFANVTYNTMRGGTFDDGYRFPRWDVEAFLEARNAPVAQRYRAWLRDLPDVLTLDELAARTEATGDCQLQRLVGEYLPLTFSRRHGDPSRPWNRFAIVLRDQLGNKRFAYEGNWRDIFQNWEALATSFPGWLPAMINVFLNASTADGYNPYRITREGIDWEVPEEGEFAQYGYWGDHQLVYLLRLLEADCRYHPGRLASLLDERGWAYAVVPYEIAPLAELLADPRHGVSFDDGLHDRLVTRAASIGGDGKLLHGDDGEVALVTLAEKLLVPLLAKLSNFVPGGGIWLNTQRPEWNDANNALAGWGLSMVTVYHMRRYLQFCRALWAESGLTKLTLTEPVATLLQEVTNALEKHRDDTRRTVEALGLAGQAHRTLVYTRQPRPTTRVATSEVMRLFEVALTRVDEAIAASRRDDGLFESYNTLEIRQQRARVHQLTEMLEGQVAVLGAGFLSDVEVLELLQALRRSALYRDDQHSYLLYPDRELAPFLERNTLEDSAVSQVPILQRLLDDNDPRLVVRDIAGNVHFQGDLRNAHDVMEVLDEIGAAAEEARAVLDLWEEVFAHRSFTGRSSTFFAFEGLGSIYWHMVAKLLLAIQECFLQASDEHRTALAEAYHSVRRGLGFTKRPEVFGAIPTDPYSHSPRHLGAQQPGMTGQVKEELLTRLGELGVEVDRGCLSFRPRLLIRREFAGSRPFHYIDLDRSERVWTLPADSLAFTLCQTPICYVLSESASLTVVDNDGAEVRFEEPSMDAGLSAQLFDRTNTVARVVVEVPRAEVHA